VKIGAPFALAFWRVVGGQIMVSCTKKLIGIFETIIVCIFATYFIRFITGVFGGAQLCVNVRTYTKYLIVIFVIIRIIVFVI